VRARGTAIGGATIGLDELAWLGTTAYAVGCVWACKAASTKPRRGGDARAVSERAASFVSSLRMFAPMCALYGFLLYRSWTPETLSLMMPGSLEEGLATGKAQFIPTLSSISTLLGARATATSAWAHLLCVNVFVARHVALKTRERFERDGRAPPVAHTLALAAVAGPLGLLAYALTSFVYDAWSRRVAAAAAEPPVARWTFHVMFYDDDDDDDDDDDASRTIDCCILCNL
jgi:hypothetical protein